MQWKKSLLILAFLILFYFIAFGLITLALLASVGLFLAGGLSWSSAFVAKSGLAVLAIASVVAYFHFLEARRTGAPYILRRLDARTPDLQDRYHFQFSNVVEEMRIAAGLPRVNAYVLPQFALNSLALILPDGTPGVVVTEGLLAECTRDELQAVVAHELAHISRGDAFYVTLVCSLANFLERWREALEPEETSPPQHGSFDRRGASPALLYLTVIFTSITMRLLTTLLSRERELLADAAAVEISRHPQALARALYKVNLKSSLIGDFGLAYSPLFIVAPGLTGESEGFFSRLFNSHPPLMKRVKLLARMAGLEPAHILRQVWEEKRLRQEARTVLRAEDEHKAKAVPTGEGPPSLARSSSGEENKTWLIQNPQGQWEGPFALEEMIFLTYFTPIKLVENVIEGVRARAREFPQIRLALDRLRQKKPIHPSKKDRCPRCHVPLNETFYEGVAIKVCPRCAGKLVNASKMERILLRQEFDFSPALLDKTRAYHEQFLANPIKTQRQKEKDARHFLCPVCGQRMVARPYNYQYFIPVDKCLGCGEIWFDADELETLQILIEKRI